MQREYTSYSRINLYQRCPAAYMVKYIVGYHPHIESPALTFGSQFHKDCEEYYLGKIDTPPIGMKPYLDARGIIGVEREFTVKLHSIKDYRILDVPLFGYIDAETNDTLIDYKTSSKAWSSNDINTSLQATLYVYADYLISGTIKNFEYVIWRKDLSDNSKKKVQIISTKRTEEDMQRAFDTLWDIREKIIEGKFEKTPGWHCKMCPYRSICKKSQSSEELANTARFLI